MENENKFKLLITIKYNDNIVRTRTQYYSTFDQALLMKSYYNKIRSRDLIRDAIKDFNTRIVII